ncbi:MAG: HD-GYP domain-containing protein [Gemmatimonadetes bacterium]|nr:HD-GYP domain-containing protein [Gemmatimonadota bacterium]
MDRQTKRFVGLVAAAALVAAGLSARVGLGFDEYSLQAAGFFALLGALASVLAYNLPRDAAGNISFIPLLSAAAIAPSLSVVLACTLAVTLAEVMHRREFVKAVFNISQTSLAIAVAVLIYHALGGTPLSPSQNQPIFPFMVAFTAFFIVNTACVSGVIAVSQHQRFLGIWWQNTRGALVYDFFAIPAVYGFAFVYAKFDAGWCAALALPLFGLRQLYKTNWQLERINEELLQVMVAAIEARDPYTSGHSQRVAEYAGIVARSAGVGARSVGRLAMAGLLHDIGKIYEEFAPILRKPGRLTAEEFEIMKTHSEKGARLVAKVSQLRDLVGPIRSHHEAWDGSGYPDGLQGSAIPLWARVIAFADTIDAMTTDRPYREALDADTVRAELVRESGTQFDPVIARRLTSDEHWSEMAVAISRNIASRRSPTHAIPAVRLVGERAQARA